MASRMETEMTAATRRDPALPPVLDDLEIRVLWTQRDQLSAGAWNQPRLTNDHWRLYHNDAPGASLTIEGVQTRFAAGGVYLIPSGLTMSSGNTGDFSQTFVHFDIADMPLVLLRELFPGPTHIPDRAGLVPAVLALRERLAWDSYPNLTLHCMAVGAVYLAFASFLAALSDDLIDRCWTRMSALRPILPALKTIREGLDCPLRNSVLADACHLSEDYFIRTFHAAVGLSPAQYILKRRVSLAAQRLLFTDESIDRIAARTGFRDRFYFTRVFARETGIAPASYRRRPRM